MRASRELGRAWASAHLPLLPLLDEPLPGLLPLLVVATERHLEEEAALLMARRVLDLHRLDVELEDARRGVEVLLEELLLPLALLLQPLRLLLLLDTLRLLLALLLLLLLARRLLLGLLRLLLPLRLVLLVVAAAEAEEALLLLLLAVLLLLVLLLLVVAAALVAVRHATPAPGRASRLTPGPSFLAARRRMQGTGR